MVRAGYKQTEVGEIPEEWDVKKIEAIASITTGDKNTQDKIEDGIYPFFVRSQTIENINSYSFDGESVLTAGDGVGTGKIFHYINGRFDYHQRVYNIYNFKPEVNGFYFYKYFSNKFYDRIMSMTAKSSVDSVRREMISEMKVAVPTELEQKAIAKALSDVDELLVSLEKLIAKKRDIKTATMQQLLTGKKRLSGFGEGKGYQQTELGEIPEDWELRPIGNSFEFKNGLNKEKKYFGYGTPIVNYMDVYSHVGLKKSDISGKVHVSSDEKRAYGARKGDVFFTRTSETVDEIGAACTLLDEVDDAVFSGFILRARPIDDFFDLYFKKYCFETWVVRKQIMATSSYTTRALTNGRLLSQVKIPAPADKDEQNSIAKFLTNMDNELVAISEKLKKTKSIKQGMMQELLTGRTRLI